MGLGVREVEQVSPGAPGLRFAQQGELEEVKGEPRRAGTSLRSAGRGVLK